MKDYIKKKVGKYTVRIYYNGGKEWRYKGRTHREGGPAIELADGSKTWYINGKRHREDGPAVIFSDSGDGAYKAWYLNGVDYDEKSWKVKMRKKKLKVLGL